jgi:hypothetical protein
MLSMKVVTAKAASASGAEFPHATPVGDTPVAAGTDLAVVDWMLSVEDM